MKTLLLVLLCSAPAWAQNRASRTIVTPTAASGCSTCVLLTTDQTIDGLKTFNGQITAVGGINTQAIANSPQLTLYDKTNGKTFYFLNNNNVFQVYGNNGSTLIFSLTGDTGVIGNFTSTKNRGTCTLNGGTPSSCTATVNASAICVCSEVGASAAVAAGGCAVGLASTTLTITGPATSTAVVNYLCF